MKIKNLINSILRKFGYKITKRINKPLVENISETFTMKKALERCSKRGLNISTVIDVGASNSSWSRDCMKNYPKANYFLVEAQNEHEEGLLKFKNDFIKGDYLIAVAGNKEGKIFFDKSDLFGGIASNKKIDENYSEIPMISLDNEIKKRNLKPPYLLKLDTHGFEVPILEGAKDIIKNAELIIIETYNYKLTNDSLKYFELCVYMEKLGFSTIEMVDFMLREHDNSFWQMDTFFVPSDNKCFNYNEYK
jgi:FkbM family methyltransferase